MQFDWENTRYPSVLGRIGLGYLFAGLIFLYTDIRQQVVWFWGLLLVYWAAMTLIPVPGFGAGNLTVEGNLVAYLDRMLLPGKLHQGVHDPEGILSTVPAISTALLGALAGHLLKDTSRAWTGRQKALILAAAGLACLATGYLWGRVFPVNKSLWTSSFVLVAGGWSLLLLSLFYYLVDVRGWEKWAFFFVVIGLNPITIYLARHFFDLGYTTDFLFNGIAGLFGPDFQPVIWYIGYTGLGWLFVYFLYRQRVFLKV
ncbi:MAG: hypothetical protein OHK0039_10110 [Bacteroidia bacterium]